jgi:hypothetical protein
MLSRRLWKITRLLAGFLLAGPAVGQTSDCVPNGRSAGPSATSPDGRYEVLKVFCSNQANERELALVLRNVQSGESRTLYAYDRDATVVWSPDSRWIAINDYAGSDYTNNVVVSIDRDTPPIDLKQRLLQSKPKQRILESDHLYLSASEWKSQSEIQLVAWGHDSGRKIAFCRCFLMSLGGSIRQCHLPVTGDDPEGYCQNIMKDAPPLAASPQTGTRQ